MQTFSSKHPDETITVAVGFVHLLNVNETISTASVTAAVHRGTDSNPSGILGGGAAQILGSDILKSVLGGIDRVDYQLAFTVGTSLGNTYIASVILPVRLHR
jgi:hypothetical protein